MTVEQRILASFGLKKSDLTEELWKKVQETANMERSCRKTKIPPLLNKPLMHELSLLAENLNKHKDQWQM